MISTYLENYLTVPVHEDGSLAVIESQVAGGELLVPKESSIFAAVEDQVGHKTT
jgi:hypothetical protein